jgi:hypothetical protein
MRGQRRRRSRLAGQSFRRALPCPCDAMPELELGRTQPHPLPCEGFPARGKVFSLALGRSSIRAEEGWLNETLPRIASPLRSIGCRRGGLFAVRISGRKQASRPGRAHDEQVGERHSYGRRLREGPARTHPPGIAAPHCALPHQTRRGRTGQIQAIGSVEAMPDSKCPSRPERPHLNDGKDARHLTPLR